MSTLYDAAADLGVMVRIVDDDDWVHGESMGVCKHRNLYDLQPVVEAKVPANQADLAVTLIHEYAHALLHFDVDDECERSKREVEAEAVAYIVGRYVGLDTSGSAFYLSTWQEDDTNTIQDQLDRISQTAEEIIKVVDECEPRGRQKTAL
nr:hypothetical protein [Haladaptatus halobius]